MASSLANTNTTGATSPTDEGNSTNTNVNNGRTAYFIDVENDRYPFCVVWTPIPLVTWILPFVGHMGICDSFGVCHDFAGPYFISRDNLAFGRPCKYWCLHPEQLGKLDGLMGNQHESVKARVELKLKDEGEHMDDAVSGSSSRSSNNPNRYNSNGDNSSPKFTAADMWDAGVYRAAEQYRKQMYNFFCNNCHSYVATALEQGEAISKCNPSTSGATTSASASPPTALSYRTAKGSISPVIPTTNSTLSTSVSIGNTTSQPIPITRLKTWNMVTLAAQVFLFGKYVSVGRFLQAHLPFFILVALIVGFTFMGKSL